MPNYKSTALILIILNTLIVSCTQQITKPSCSILTEKSGDRLVDNSGFQTYYEIDVAKQCSKQTGRPILLMFYSWCCQSAPGIHWRLLADKKINKIIRDNYIFTVLYIDDKKLLADTTQRDINGNVMRTIGEKNYNFQISHFKNNAIPYYAFVDSNFNKIAEPMGYTPIKEKAIFFEHLTEGLEK